MRLSPQTKWCHQCLMRATCFALTMVFLSCGQADEPDEVLKRVVESREQIRNGSFTASGVRRYRTKTGEEGELPTQVECIFDITSRLLWFHRRGHVRISIQPSSSLTPETAKAIVSGEVKPDANLRSLSGTLVRNSEYLTYWYAIGVQGEPGSMVSNIGLYEPETTATCQFVDVFDVTSAGMATIREFDLGFGIDEVLEECRKTSSIVSVDVQESGLIDLVFSGARYRRTLTVSPDQGFTCQQMVMVGLDETGKIKEFPRSLSTAKWQNLNGVWVPQGIHLTDEFSDGSASYRSYEFKWRDVNAAEIDPNQFTYRKIPDVWEGAYVYERRSGQRKLIDAYGGRALETLKFMQRTEGGDVDGPTASIATTEQKPRTWLIILNGAGAVLLLILFFWKRRKASQERPGE